MRSFDLRTARLRSCPDVPGLPEVYKNDLKELFRVWNSKLSRNVMRSRYYDGHEVVKNLGIAVPDDFAELDAVVGWPAKAVDTLADMSNFDSYTGTSTSLQILDEITDANDFYATYDMMLPDELVHSCAAVTVTAGRDGIPQLNAHSAITAAMTWSYERHRIKAGITVAETNEAGVPIAYNLYEDDCVIYIYMLPNDSGLWGFVVMPHAMGRPLIEPFVYRPSLRRPFGVSRINREVMSITDNAMRTVLRGEVGSEFFTSPQKALLGAPDGMFPNRLDEALERLPETYDPEEDDEDDEGYDDPDDMYDPYGDDEMPSPRRVKLDARTAWEYTIGHLMAISRDEEGNVPQVVQFSASSMEPHISYLRALAARFSGATCVPLNELGIIQDNPSSAEAIDSQRSALVREANKLNTINGRSLVNIGRMGIAIALNKPYYALTEDERTVGTHFMDPDRPALVSRADAMTKLASSAPWLVNTRVYWEKVGLTDEQIDVVLAAGRQAESTESMANIVANALNSVKQVENGEGE